MVKVRHEKLDKEIDIQRVIGTYTQEKAGPTVIFLCGTHGNETSSVFAIHEIFKKLEQTQPDINGEMVAAFAGNLKALEQDVRYIDTDLNRGWVTKRLKKLGFLTDEDELQGHEKKEQRALIDVLQKVIGRAVGEIYVFDLHTTSSASPPFTAISDTIRNRQIALKFPLPCVLGFDEQTKGTFMNFINDMGLAGVAFEAGEHYALSSIENNINFIWTALKLVGSIDEPQIPDYEKIFLLLGKEKFGSHKIFDLTYHYTVKEEGRFRMRSGYSTFDEIEEGEHLADDRDGPVYAPESDGIFMRCTRSKAL